MIVLVDKQNYRVKLHVGAQSYYERYVKISLALL